MRTSSAACASRFFSSFWLWSFVVSFRLRERAMRLLLQVHNAHLYGYRASYLFGVPNVCLRRWRRYIAEHAESGRVSLLFISGSIGCHQLAVMYFVCCIGRPLFILLRLCLLSFWSVEGQLTSRPIAPRQSPWAICSSFVSSSVFSFSISEKEF